MRLLRLLMGRVHACTSDICCNLLFFVLSALTGGVKVPMKSKYVLVFFSRIAPMSHLYTSMGPRVAKTFFLGIFEVISVFVFSWKIIKRLLTYPALRGVHYLSYSKGFLYLTTLPWMYEKKNSVLLRTKPHRLLYRTQLYIFIH